MWAVYGHFYHLNLTFVFALYLWFLSLDSWLLVNKATSVSVQCLDNSYALTLSSQLMRNFLIMTFSNPDIALVLKKVKVSKVNSQNVEQTIDGETGWRMVVPTTLKCFLCGGQVIYKNKDTTRSRTTSPSPSSTWPLVVTNGHYRILQFQLLIPLQIFTFKTSPCQVLQPLGQRARRGIRDGLHLGRL